MAFNFSNPFDEIVGAPFRFIGMEPSRIPIIGGLFEDPAQAELQQAMEQAQTMYGDRSAEMETARMNALRQIFSMFQPYNQLLQQQYGKSMPLENILTNPMTGLGPVQEQVMSRATQGASAAGKVAGSGPEVAVTPQGNALRWDPNILGPRKGSPSPWG